MITENPVDIALKLEKELQLPKNFIVNLINEDDWSLVIKLHAIFEAAATFILTNKLQNKNLETIFSNLELSNKKIGKLAFLKAYNMLDSDERGYISMLSEIRNMLVHDIKNVGFNFNAYIDRLDSNKKRNFINYAGYAYADSFEISGKVVQRDKFVAENPKLAIWQTGIGILAIIYLQKKLDDMEVKINTHIVEIARLKGFTHPESK